MITAEEILAELAARRDERALAGMARYGIRVDKAYGWPIPGLRALAKRVGGELGRRDPARHTLALELWRTGVHEAQLLACFLDLPEMVTEEQAEAWVVDLERGRFAGEVPAGGRIRVLARLLRSCEKWVADPLRPTPRDEVRFLRFYAGGDRVLLRVNVYEDVLGPEIPGGGQRGNENHRRERGRLERPLPIDQGKTRRPGAFRAGLDIRRADN